MHPYIINKGNRPQVSLFNNSSSNHNNVMALSEPLYGKYKHSFLSDSSNNNSGSSSNNSGGGVASSSSEHDSIHSSLLYPNQKQFKWHSMVDNFTIEFLSSTVVNLTCIFSYDFRGDSFMLQFTPSLIIGLLMMGLKDEDYYFPDASPLVTILMWAIGGYNSWVQAVSRLSGHFVGFFISLWICTNATIPNLIRQHVFQPPSIVFVLELIMTAIEHLAVVYIIVPLLPSPFSFSHHHNNNNPTYYTWNFNRVRHKSHKENTPPANKLIVHAALTFVAIHWCMWRTFETEMNPSTTILLAYIRSLQVDEYNNSSSNSTETKDYNKNDYGGIDIWGRCVIAVWGQLVGLLICIIYSLMFLPKESKVWHLKTN